MKKIRKILKQIWEDEAGQGATEYILMITVVVALVLVFRKQIVQIISDRTSQLAGELGQVVTE